jgi:hypothetical protein
VSIPVGDPETHGRLLDALGNPPGVVVAAFVEPGCTKCRTMARAVARFERYPGVSTAVVPVDADGSGPGAVGLADVPTLVVLDGAVERLRRVGHHDEDALVSSVRHALDDVPPAYEHRSP